ncbi:MAG: hypothetical protein QXG97_01610 [Nitrososphaerota archaeon]
MNPNLEPASDYSIFTLLGVILIILGVVTFLLPYLLQADLLKRLEELPPILVYVYRHDGFYLATSPILIVICLAYLAYKWLSKGIG